MLTCLKEGIGRICKRVTDISTYIEGNYENNIT
jgi:hypothetical protein